MPKQLVEIDVPEGCEIVESKTYMDVEDASRLKVIVKIREAWQWPEWIKSGTWMAMDGNGTWWLYNCEPMISGGAWCCDGSALETGRKFLKFIDLDPPPCDDWRTSKRQKP